MHFGATLRLLRIDAGLGLRELARQIGVSGPYLSRVENGHDAVPTPERLMAIADALGVPRAILLELGRQTGAAMSDYLARVPAASAFMLEVARRGLDAVQLARLMTVMDREFPASPQPAAARPLSALLEPARIVLHLSCSDMEDLIAVAAAKMQQGLGQEIRSLAAHMSARERESSTAIGAGFVLPHAVVAGVKPAAALMTLARPLHVSAPDSRPACVAIALVCDDPAIHLSLLAGIARLAHHELAAELVAARTPDEALSAIRRVESPW